MTIPYTRLHSGRVLGQIKLNLLNLQADLRRNAQAHKDMALKQMPTLDKLQAFIIDGVAAYRARLRWVSDWLADATKKQQLADLVKSVGWAESDLTDVADGLSVVVNALGSASIKTYADIVAACDAVLASVPPPLSLWPE